jgi:hypothetical protein
MRLKDLALLIFVTILTLSLYSCKDNVNGTPGNGNVLYTADSIKLESSGVGILNLYNEKDYFSPYSNIGKIEIDYTGETNIDSSKGICHMIVKVAAQSGGSVPFYMDYNGITSINQSYSYNVPIPSDINLWYVQFRVEINNGFTPVQKVIMIRNIKVVAIG